MAISALVTATMSAYAAPAPVTGRFQVFRTGAGYELRGYRMEVGDGDRFALSAGMSASKARGQLLSVQWDATSGLTDPKAEWLQGQRTLPGAGNVAENVLVILDPSRGHVRTVIYRRLPAQYSKTGLDYYLRAAFGEGRVVVNQDDRVQIDYWPHNGQLLRVEAIRVVNEATAWQLVFRVDAAAPVANSTTDASGE